MEELNALKVINENVFIRTLIERNNFKSLQNKIKVSEELYTLSTKCIVQSVESNSNISKYLVKMDCRDEFFRFILGTENKWRRSCQRNEYCRLWFGFLRQISESLDYAALHVPIVDYNK